MVERGDELRVAEDVALPAAEVLTGRGFVTGKSGSGKSNTASVLAEELLDLDARLLVVDTDGEYYGLKEEYELLHVGADDHCDVVVGPDDAETIADLVLEEAVPTVVDVSGFLEAERADRLVYEVAKHVFSRAGDVRQPCLLLVEEVHEFVPEQGGLDDVGEMLVRVAKRGRKRGLGLCGLSQRPAAVDKDFITQCDWLAWHRLTWANDTKVVGRVLGSEYAEEIESLDAGEAFLQTDWDGERRRVQFRRKRTFDAGATPGFGDAEDPDLRPVPDEWLHAFEAGPDRIWAREGQPTHDDEADADEDPTDDAIDADGDETASATEETPPEASEQDAESEREADDGPAAGDASTDAGRDRAQPPSAPPNDAHHVTWELGQLVFYVVRRAVDATAAGLRRVGAGTRGGARRVQAALVGYAAGRSASAGDGSAEAAPDGRARPDSGARPVVDLLVGAGVVVLTATAVLAAAALV